MNIPGLKRVMVRVDISISLVGLTIKIRNQWIRNGKNMSDTNFEIIFKR